MVNELKKFLKTKEHVIWDWNGTLLNDVDHAIATMNVLLEDHNLPPLDRRRYQDIFEFPVRRYYDALGFDYAKESFESLCHRFVDGFMAGFAELPLVEEVRKIVFELKKEGIKQSILSATDQKNLDGMIEHFALRDNFAFVFGIDNKMAGSKVDRGHDLLKLSQVAARQTVIVGDTLHDLEVARELGIEAVLIDHGHQSAKKLRRHHHRVMSL